MFAITAILLFPVLIFLFIFGYKMSINEKIIYGVPNKEDRKDLLLELNKTFINYFIIMVLFNFISFLLLFILSTLILNFYIFIMVLFYITINVLINIKWLYKFSIINKSVNFFIKND